MIYYCVLDVASNDFKSLQTPVTIINDDYTKWWGSTASEEKIDKFKNNDLKHIFETLPNFLHPFGYTLVTYFFEQILLIYNNIYMIYILYHLDTSRLLIVF